MFAKTFFSSVIDFIGLRAAVLPGAHLASFVSPGLALVQPRRGKGQGGYAVRQAIAAQPHRPGVLPQVKGQGRDMAGAGGNDRPGFLPARDRRRTGSF
ncbi:hypothetical protein G3572_20825 [Rhodobacter sp. ETT8]|uniref:Uncharacterized protein n=1 Tax=Pseudotabrizicola algicola TaxID=2709381 RepID=A0A6B3RTV9_9RHOB|nr:hypothetical protein [Pseudotabrizicola algicola]